MALTSYSEIEIFVYDDRIELWRRAKRVLVLGVDEVNKLQFVLDNTEDMEWSENLTTHPKKIDVFLVRYQREGMGLALPRQIKEPVSTRMIKAHRKMTNTGPMVGVEHIVESQRDKVLNAILDSYIDHPRQTKAETVAITKAIATRYEERMYAVAGVRAALSGGKYGDRDTLVANRAATRSAKAFAALEKRPARNIKAATATAAPKKKN